MSGITIKVDDRRARARIDALQASLGNAQPAFALIGRVLITRIRLCFRLSVDPWGSPWAALKFRTGQPLKDRGRLLGSIKSAPDATGVTVGTNLKYARTHQYGAEIKAKPGYWARKSKHGPSRQEKRLVFKGPGGMLIFAKKVTIPARPFLPLRRDSAVVALPPQWSVAVVQALRRYFIDAVSKKAA